MKHQFHEEYVRMWLSYKHKFSVRPFNLVYFLQWTTK